MTSCREETKVSVLISARSLVDLRFGDWTKVSRGDELEDEMLLRGKDRGKSGMI